MKRRRTLRTWLSVLLVALALLIIVSFSLSLIQGLRRPKVTLYLGDGVFAAVPATTPEARTRGLSGTSSLAADQAMLFDFGQSDRWQIWMKDMHYAIDVVWLDADKRVVYIVKNMTPDTYPTTYAPQKPARYVVELLAGTVASRAITINTTAHFELPGEGQ